MDLERRPPEDDGDGDNVRLLSPAADIESDGSESVGANVENLPASFVGEWDTCVAIAQRISGAAFFPYAALLCVMVVALAEAFVYALVRWGCKNRDLPVTDSSCNSLALTEPNGVFVCVVVFASLAATHMRAVWRQYATLLGEKRITRQADARRFLLLNPPPHASLYVLLVLVFLVLLMLTLLDDQGNNIPRSLASFLVGRNANVPFPSWAVMTLFVALFVVFAVSFVVGSVCATDVAAFERSVDIIASHS